MSGLFLSSRQVAPIRAVLTDADYEIEAVTDGEQAWEAALLELPDIHDPPQRGN